MVGDCIHQEPLEFGGHIVRSEIPAGYVGPCAVVAENGTEEVICAFPLFSEASRAAVYATKPDGGYGSVKIKPCDANIITHAEFCDWAFRI